MMELDWGDSREEKGIQVTAVVGFRAFITSIRVPFPVLVDRGKEYLMRLRLFAASSGTDASFVDPSADRPRREMIFECVYPSCYRGEPFAASAEQSDCAEGAVDVGPAEDMHRAVSEIKFTLESARRWSGSSQARLASWGQGQKANGMSAGG